MLRQATSTLLITLLVGTALLSGCTANKAHAPSPASANAKAPLVVPSVFASETAKQEFALKAVADGHYTEAVKLLQESVAVQPTGFAFARLGTAHYNLNKYQDAMDAWKKAAELDASLAGEMHNNIGNALRDAGRHEDAKAEYRTALELDPSRWNAAVNLANLLRTQGALDEAVAVLESAVKSSQQSDSLASVLQSYREELRLAN